MTGRRTKKYTAVALAVTLALAVLWGVPGLLPAGAQEPSDSALTAAISFRQNGGAPTASLLGQSYPSADALGGFRFGATPFTVINEAGQTVDSASMVVQVKGKIITSGVPVSNWSIDGTMKLVVDGSDFRSYTLAKSGTTSIPDPIIIPINSASEVAIPVSELKDKWGIYTYGEHTVKIIGSATMTVNFVDQTVLSKVFTAQDLGSVKFNSTTDATATFEMSSNYGATGTTTETTTPPPDSGTTTPPPTVTYVTDTWGSTYTLNGVLPYIDVDPAKSKAQGMIITDPARQGKELVSATFNVYRNQYAGPGSVHVELRSGSTVLATSDSKAGNAFPRGEFVNQTFTFPEGTMTPNGQFGIIFVYVPDPAYGETSINLRLSNTGTNSYAGGYIWIDLSTASGWEAIDLMGSAKYKA